MSDLTPQEQVRVWTTLLEHPGWRQLEREVKDYIVRMVGEDDPKILQGMKWTLMKPQRAIDSLTETIKRERGPDDR